MEAHDDKKDITIFAKTNFRGKEVPFGIKADDRRRHMYVIGKTGMGKTTLMENMIIQDIMNGKGLAFVDPHGDSVEKILEHIPSNRVNDVVYFNPADREFPIAFNILESVDPNYKHLVASGLMGVFTKIWAGTWSARMEYILNNAILALLDSPGNTLLGIARMMVDKKYRKRIVDNIKDPMVRSFWMDEFANWPEKYRMEAVAPIQNKVGQFLSTSIVRNIIGQPRSTIDLRDIMDNNKIFLLNLSKGRLGEDNSALLGAMIITKLQLAALSRVDIPESQRSDFYLYVDEFQNFATQSFATILSEARKYRLNLIIGHQYIGQLIQDNKTDVRDAVFGNVGTIATFRVGAADAEFLEKEFFPTFLQNDLVNLPKYNIILRLMINGVASDPFSATTLSPAAYQKTENREKVIRVSRERYANPESLVMQKITQWMGQEYHEGVAVVAAGAKIEGREDYDEEETTPQPAAPAAPQAQPQSEPVAIAPVADMPSFETQDQPEAFNVPEAPMAPEMSAPKAQTEKPKYKAEPRTAQHHAAQSHNHQNHSGQRPLVERRSAQRRQVSNRRTQNPIWDKVADLSKDKNVVDQLGNAITQSLKPKREEQHDSHKEDHKKEIKHEHKTEHSSRHPSDHDQSRTVLKPGESVKF